MEAKETGWLDDAGITLMPKLDEESEAERNKLDATLGCIVRLPQQKESLKRKLRTNSNVYHLLNTDCIPGIT